ncbi:MAG: hypothetical protein AAGJ18_12275 [Bacteroidota bacterium]
MRSKLQKFTQFAQQLLPHEVTYLLKVQQLADADRLAILQRIDYNCQHTDQFTPYDTNIDKRKYHHLQNWMERKLREIDVDEQFAWMSRLEHQIMMDTISSTEEKELLKAIKTYEYPCFFFVKFYELVQQYGQFLLVRIRYADYQVVQHFLQTHRANYQLSQETNRKIHQATEDIIAQYAGDARESSQWEQWLKLTFYDLKMDGHNRYLALVRLAFIAFNYRKLTLLQAAFDYMDEHFGYGQNYSKRLLLNYYNNRLMLHSRLREYEKAAYYGYLSIRAKNHDYLNYVNNLCAVLLRLDRNQEALDLMKQAAAAAKKTANFHSRVGYVSFYLEALNKNGLHQNAVSYGRSFLTAYHKEILQYRWHLFFSVYFEALLHRRQFAPILQITRKYRLLDKDQQYAAKANYLPSIPIYYWTAQYQEGLLAKQQLMEQLSDLLGEQPSLTSDNRPLEALLGTIRPIMPEVLVKWGMVA